MPSISARLATAALLLSLAASAQTPSAKSPALAPPLLSPKAAYADAMHPLEQTRASVSNWSDAETAALGVSIQQATAACAARDPAAFNGDDLIDLARLCALGQAWPAVITASTRYIDADLSAKPLLIRAYAGRLDAELHLKDEPAALRDGKAMLAALPYDGLTDEVINEALEYMHFTYTTDAIRLAEARQPALLAALHIPVPASGAPPATPPADTPAVAATPIPAYTTAPLPSLHELFATALGLPALLQFNNQAEQAQAAATELDAALPAALTADDALPIAAARRRYALLGKPLPPIALKASLDSVVGLPAIPAAHAITALLLFPDWCTQCVRMGSQFPQTVFLVNNHEAYFYGLLAQTGLVHAANPKTEPTERLAGTPTVTVGPAVLTQFDASDFPLLILADGNGVVRLVQTVAEDALTPGGALDSAAAHVGDLWPVQPAARPLSGSRQARLSAPETPLHAAH